jgi:hypothetical protein
MAAGWPYALGESAGLAGFGFLGMILTAVGGWWVVGEAGEAAAAMVEVSDRKFPGVKT